MWELLLPESLLLSLSMPELSDEDAAPWRTPASLCIGLDSL